MTDNVPNIEIKAKKKRVWGKRPRIPVELSQELHDEFKAAVSIKGETMIDVIHRFIRAFCSHERDTLDWLIEKYKNKGTVM